MKKVKFYNISSSGNSFFLVQSLEDLQILFAKEINNLADGILLLTESKTSDAHFAIFNKDKSRAKICGNGLASAGYFLKKIKNEKKDVFLFLTDNGYYKVSFKEDKAEVFFPYAEIIYEDENSAFMNAGNLHLIDEVEEFSIDDMIKKSEDLEGKMNVHQIKKIEEDYYSYLSLESGVGFTKSCISGACSIYSFLKNKDKNMKRLHLKAPGGILELEDKDGLISIKTNVDLIFIGECDG